MKGIGIRAMPLYEPAPFNAHHIHTAGHALSGHIHGKGVHHDDHLSHIYADYQNYWL